MARITNRDKLLRKMADLPPKVREALKPAIRESAAEIMAAQKRLVPKKSGALERSIQMHVGNVAKTNSGVLGGGSVKGDPDLTVTITAGDEAAYYARFVEFGSAPHKQGGLFKGSQHPGTRAQSFFFPPYRAHRKKARSMIARAGRKAIREVAAK